MDEPERRTLLRENGGGRAVHDVGGLDMGPIDRHDHDLALWEKRTDALLMLLVGPKCHAFTVDALRRVIEDYGQQTYDETAYYEKWIRAIRNLLVEQEIVTREEIERRATEIAAAVVRDGRAVSSEQVGW